LIPQQIEGCLWQGLIAVSPGHPIVAKAVESIVNYVRKRYSLVDLDSDLCPRPNLSVNRMDKLSAFTGSCLLAKSVNSALRRPPNEPFVPGELSAAKKSADNIPGRVVVLGGNGDDMGGRRLTHTSKNSVVAQVDLPVADEHTTSSGDSLSDGAPYEFSQLYYAPSERSYETIEILVKAQSTGPEFTAATA
jgi:hypothetical protein